MANKKNGSESLENKEVELTNKASAPVEQIFVGFSHVVEDQYISALEYLTKHNHEIPHTFIDIKYKGEKNTESVWDAILKKDRVI